MGEGERVSSDFTAAFTSFSNIAIGHRSEVPGFENQDLHIHNSTDAIVHL